MEGVQTRLNDAEEKEQQQEEGKIIVLGIRTDSKSRDLLTWTLSNVANSGDRVVAIHVHRLPFPVGQQAEELELMRRAYESSCRLREIDLVMKICRGFSVRRTLVQQAKSYSASFLVLGENKSCTTIRFSLTSIPKYCLKRLSRKCCVVAVNNGNIVFGKGAVASVKWAAGHNDSVSVEENFSISSSVSGSQCSSKVIANGYLQESKSDDQMSSTSSVEFDFQKPPNELGSSWSLLRMPLPNHRRTISMNLLCHLVRKHRSSDAFAAGNLFKDGNLSPFLLEEGNFKMVTCKRFHYAELLQATCNFSVDRIIGKGGSSLVYKGILPDGKEVAVKVLKPSKDSLKLFSLEIELINTLNHKNIIPLLGFCAEDNHMVLVYDFLSRGSLEEILYEVKWTLNWHERYRIAVAVAEALNYLHDCETTESVIHMDVKSSNILLAEDFVPKLSDFGLARRPKKLAFHTSSVNPAGTFGYLAPEYLMLGQVSTKIDVYAFGVVLLELISGRKPISSDGIKGDKSLVMWALRLLQNGKDHELLDPRLCGKYNADQMEGMILAASLCLQWDSQYRPSMSCVLKLLQGDDDSRKWAKSQINSLGNLANLEIDDLCPVSSIKSHHNLLMANIEDDPLSAGSDELLAGYFGADGKSMEDYLQERSSLSQSSD